MDIPSVGVALSFLKVRLWKSLSSIEREFNNQRAAIEILSLIIHPMGVESHIHTCVHIPTYNTRNGGGVTYTHMCAHSHIQHTQTYLTYHSFALQLQKIQVQCIQSKTGSGTITCTTHRRCREGIMYPIQAI